MPKEFKIDWSLDLQMAEPYTITSSKQCKELFGWETTWFVDEPQPIHAIPMEPGVIIQFLEPGEKLIPIPWAINLYIISHKIIECEGGYVG